MQKIALITGVLAVAGSANAFVPWTNPSGSGSFFNWSNGGSDNGLFGSPTLVGDNFVFFPSNFRAQSPNGSSIVGDRLQFELEAFVGSEFSNITIQEIGDYGNLGGTGGNIVQANMALFTTDLNNFRVVQDNQTFTAPAGLGNWNLAASTALDGSVQKWTKIRVVLNNNLIAISSGNGVTFIEKKVTGGIIIRVPTPGSLALLGIGGLVAVRRRR